MRNTLRYFILTCTVFGLVACGPALTPDRVGEIQEGMSSSDVKSIMGNPTEGTSLLMDPMTGATWTYRNRKSMVNIVFVNDKVVTIETKLQR